jgi:hypothetical protein
MASLKRKPAADEAARLPKWVCLAATTREDSGTLVQIQGRITARELNSLRDIEDRIAVLGRYVRLGRADRNMVADRIRAAVVRAGLVKHANRGKPLRPRARPPTRRTKPQCQAKFAASG